MELTAESVQKITKDAKLRMRNDWLYVGKRETMSNPIKPNYYTKNGLSCLDVIRAIVQDLDGFEAFCIGNVTKYTWRWKEKKRH